MIARTIPGPSEPTVGDAPGEDVAGGDATGGDAGTAAGGSDPVAAKIEDIGVGATRVGTIRIGAMRRWGALLERDLRLSVRHGADTLASMLFFVLAASLFPLALGPSPELLRRMAPAIIWVCALLAALLPLDRLFGADLEDGSLDQLMLCGLPAPAVAAAKMVAHWLCAGLPLLVMAGPIGLMFALPAPEIAVLLGGLALGTSVLSLLGGMAASIVLGARRGGVLLPLLVLPLATPALIFGAAAADAAGAGLDWRPDLLLLGAFAALALPLCPLAAGAGLRAAVE